MDLQCDHCQKEFNTNAGLYTHKQRFHQTPRIVLVKHNRSATPKFKRTDAIDDYNSKKRKKKNHPDDEHDEGFQIIDEYNDVDDAKPTRKRSADATDDYHSKKRKKKHRSDDERDEELEIIDEYNDSDDAEHDQDMEIVDEYDIDEDNNLTDDEGISPPPPSSLVSASGPKLNYKALYVKCVRNYRKMKKKFENKHRLLVSKHNTTIKKHLDEVSAKRDEEIEDLRERLKKQMNDLEQMKNIEITDRIRTIQTENQTVIDGLTAAHTAKLSNLENECNDRIRVLQDHINELQKEDGDFTSLAKAIFSCTTIEEISEIQRLIKNHQLDLVVKNHLKTLQNLFLSLSYGIIPLCDSQRVAITDSQRSLVEKVQSSSSVTAKRVLKEGCNEVINLFTIINDSLKLVRNSYNRYGSLDSA